uniref:RNA-directed DNA polymerase n=1 Tax=Cajanus cajan TaxID=3821 RepID=A0A151SV10_CAJCA|nr:Retrovirus-related Pol polyprotein from transposon opus [Cajanus cajan]
MLTEECSAIIQQKLPPKLKDPGSFVIPCEIGNLMVSKALCDLGASINLMPLSIFKRLGIGEVKPTMITLQLADRSVTCPYGVVEDVLVKVDKFIFPANFVVLDMEEDAKVPIILGRPFLATGRALIDVQQGELMLRVANEKVTFSINEALKHKVDREDCFQVEIIDALVLEEIRKYVRKSPLEGALLTKMGAKESSKKVNDEEVVDCVYQLEALKPLLSSKRGVEELNRSERGVEETTKLELKQLPSHLKFRFLDEHKLNPVIVNNELTSVEEEKLLRVLREHKSTLGWIIDDLKGISPTICMHKNCLEEDFKPVCQPQRRLNPTMKEVVRKKVIKLLDAGIIYPISDMTNENNELIPTRKVTGWRMCIDYRRLNQATRKDHFPLPFVDQMLEKLAGHECMFSIFSDLIENCIEIFMDNFSVFGSSFDSCLTNLTLVLKTCQESNLVLNWEKCHFMIKEGIVLGHQISAKGIEVDRAKVEVIEQLPPPVNVKGVRRFLGHAGFYRRFIKDFSKIAKLMTNLLEKEALFVFDDACLQAFNTIKKQLISAPIITAPNWSLPFEIMCDASDYVVGVVLGQRKENLFHVIYYASRVLNQAQRNYTTTEKELLVVVFAFDKFKPYLVGSKVIVYVDHATLRYLFAKQDAKPRLIRWILLLQEFDLEIQDKQGKQNLVADHLSRLKLDEANKEVKPILEEFPDKKLLVITSLPWFADFANFKAAGVIPHEFTFQQRKKFLHDAKFYFWDDPLLFKRCADGIIRRCVLESEFESILWHCHGSDYGGHFSGERTASKVLQSGFYWPTLFKDARSFIERCDKCQRVGNISRRNEMPLNNILEVEIFYVWGIDFMGPFPSSFSNQYILVAVDYVSKWVEASALPTNDAKIVVSFIKKHIFTRFGVPRAIISDGGSHFCNKQFESLLGKYDCHGSDYGGHFSGERTASKVLQSGFYWPTLFKDARSFIERCDKCQRVGNISRRNEMPLNNILEVEIFYVWGIDFMGPFPSSFSNQYILVVVDYVSKWVEASALPTNDAKIVVSFIKKHIFTRFGVPRAIISDGGSHYCNKQFESLLGKYGVKHKIATPYHP